MRQRKPRGNALTHTPLTSSGGSSTRLGILWTLIGKGWPERQQNGQSDSRNCTKGLDKGQWCPWKLFLIRFNQNKTHYIVKFGLEDYPPPKICGKNKRRVFLDIFSPPDNNSRVRFPVKNLFPVLANWWTFAVWHCTTLQLLYLHTTLWLNMYSVILPWSYKYRYRKSLLWLLTLEVIRMWAHIETSEWQIKGMHLRGVSA